MFNEMFYLFLNWNFHQSKIQNLRLPYLSPKAIISLWLKKA